MKPAKQIIICICTIIIALTSCSRSDFGLSEGDATDSGTTIDTSHVEAVKTSLEKPTFSVGSGEQNYTEIHVAIESSVADTKIYYTSDGGDPACDGAPGVLYSKPILLQNSTTLKAINCKIDDSGKIQEKSGIASNSYIINNVLYTLYVDGANGATGNPGTPEKPIASINEAIAKAQLATPAIIKIAQGTYKEAITVDSSVFFAGGYTSDWSRNDPFTYPSIIEYEATATGSDTSPQAAVRLQGSSANGVYLWGIQIKATSAVAGGHVAGIYVNNCKPNLSLNNISVTGENSYGIFITNSAQPIFTNNYIKSYGAQSANTYGVYIVDSGSAPVINGCAITSNTELATGHSYGVYIKDCEQKTAIINSVICVADKGFESSGLHIMQGSPKIWNNAINAASSNTSYGIFIDLATPDIQNNILFTIKSHNSYGLWENAASPLKILNNNFFGHLIVYHDFETAMNLANLNSPLINNTEINTLRGLGNISIDISANLKASEGSLNAITTIWDWSLQGDIPGEIALGGKNLFGTEYPEIEQNSLNQKPVDRYNNERGAEDPWSIGPQQWIDFYTWSSYNTIPATALLAELDQVHDLITATPTVGNQPVANSVNGWLGGTLAPNGKIYAMPHDSDKILIINSIDGSIDPGSLVSTVAASSARYAGGVLGPNGKIYGIPFDSDKILEIDPTAGIVTETVPAPDASTNKWMGGVLAPNGKIYGVPFTATTIMVYKPGDATATTLADTFAGGAKWSGGVLGPDGRIYCMPYDATNILVIDPATDSAYLIAALSFPASSMKFSGAVLGPDGFIYAIPYNYTEVYVFNPKGSMSTYEYSIPVSASAAKWSGGVLGPDGNIYAMPNASSEILVIDPLIKALRSPINANGYNNLKGGIFASTGIIYGIPHGGTSVLQLDFDPTSIIDINIALSPYLNKY